MTDAVPITMPSAVRNERTGLCRRARILKLNDSPMCTRVACAPFPTLEHCGSCKPSWQGLHIKLWNVRRFALIFFPIWGVSMTIQALRALFVVVTGKVAGDPAPHLTTLWRVGWLGIAAFYAALAIGSW